MTLLEVSGLSRNLPGSRFRSVARLPIMNPGRQATVPERTRPGFGGPAGGGRRMLPGRCAAAVPERRLGSACVVHEQRL